MSNQITTPAADRDQYTNHWSAEHMPSLRLCVKNNLRSKQLLSFVP